MRSGRPPYNVKARWLAPEPNNTGLLSKQDHVVDPKDILWSESGDVDTYSDIGWQNESPMYNHMTLNEILSLESSSSTDTPSYGRHGPTGHLLLPPPPKVPEDPINYSPPKYNPTPMPQFLSDSDSYSSYSIPGVTKEYHSSLAESRRVNAQKISQIANDRSTNSTIPVPTLPVPPEQQRYLSSTSSETPRYLSSTSSETPRYLSSTSSNSPPVPRLPE